MHTWGREGVDWAGIEDAAFEIGVFITRWGRMGVAQTKEKFGTVRVYCHFGWDCFHSIFYPYHHWIHKWWPYRLDLAMSSLLMPLLNIVVVPYQKRIYRLAYKLAVKKRPHLLDEIMCCADWHEELEGVGGFTYKYTSKEAE